MDSPSEVMVTMFPRPDDCCSAEVVFYQEGTSKQCVKIRIGDHNVGLHNLNEFQLMRLADDLYDAARQIADRSKPAFTTRDHE